MNDLSLGFNAGPPTAAAASHHHHPMWHHALPHELGMYVVQPDPNSIISDPNHSVNVGVIPLLPVDDSSDLAANRYRQGAIQFWQGQQQHQQHAQPPRTLNFDSATNDLAGGSATPTCQDCGNQAKKDCTHRRCRTCCRSRGLHCSTHVKSTWVSAARRRERHTDGTVAGGASSGSTSGVKKPRLVNASQTATSHTSTSTTPTRSFDTSSSQQDANLKESLPGQVKAPAVFKCVRVTSVDDGEDEFAYQAVVKIGGHVFKGFLYDQGAPPGDGFPNLSHLHLGGGSGGSGSLDHPPEVYGGSGGAYPGAGSGYGNPMN